MQDKTAVISFSENGNGITFLIDKFRTKTLPISAPHRVFLGYAKHGESFWQIDDNTRRVCDIERDLRAIVEILMKNIDLNGYKIVFNKEPDDVVEFVLSWKK